MIKDRINGEETFIFNRNNGFKSIIVLMVLGKYTLSSKRCYCNII